MRKFGILCLFLVSFIWVYGQYEVSLPYQKSVEKGFASSFYYQLPLTGIRITLTVTKTIQHKGIYADYADKLLGLPNVIESDRSICEISDINIENFAIADPKQFYLVSIKKADMSLRWNENGTLYSVNFDNPPKNEKQGKIKQTNPSDLNKTPISTSFSGYLFSDLNLYETFDTIEKQVRIDTVITTQLIVKSDKITKNDAQKAEDLANQIIESKKMRNDLLSGASEVNYSQASLTYMNEQLLATEKDYLRCFTGYTEQRQYRYEFSVYPSLTDTLIPLALFSLQSGVLPLENGGTDFQNLYLELKPSSLRIPSKEKPSLDNSNKGFRYRKAEAANIHLYLDKRSLKKTSFPIAQWGKILALPNGNMRILLDPLTGDLLYLEF